MNVPGFTAEQSIVVPAMRDPYQQAYIECLWECRAGGGTNCEATCAAESKPPKSYPSPSGPSPGVAACCLAEYAACVATASMEGPIALLGVALCSANYVGCLQSPSFPCNL